MSSACRIKKSSFLAIVLFLLVFFSLLLTIVSDKPRIFESKVTPFPHTEGFITSKFYPSMGGRLGNYLFELLAVIGIADQLNRTPYIQEYQPFLKGKVWANLTASHPGLYKQFLIISQNMTASEVNFHGTNCCTFEDPSHLKSENSEFIQLMGNYFQSYKYFDHLKADVRSWLLPNISIQKKVEDGFPKHLKNRFLVCVHIRREDFVTNAQKDPSSAKFSLKALEYIFRKHRKNGKKFGTVVLGNEVDWEKDTFGKLPNTYVVEGSTAEEDFALSRMFCDVVLITAPSSSFGWFLGYLSKSMIVYYRDITDTRDLTSIEMHQDDFFPPDWRRLRQTADSVREVATSSPIDY